MALKTYPFSTVVNGAGLASVDISSGAQVWVVQQISTECLISDTPPVSGAPVGASSRLRWNKAIISRLAPSGDVASGLPYVPLRVGDVMTITWVGCTPGATCKATVIFDDGV